MDKQTIKSAYNTNGTELLKYLRAEVMEYLEEKEEATTCSIDKFNELVADVMPKVKEATRAIIEIVCK